MYGLLLFHPSLTFAQEPPGSFDKSFFISTGADASLHAIAVQSDGKILIGGLFNTYYGATRHQLARVNPNGSLDDGFDSPITNSVADVLAIAVQTDGAVLVGLRGGSRLMRLDSTGVPDAGFNIGSGPDGTVHAIVLQPDGKILIGGEFTHFNASGRNRIARLNSDGTLDPLFTPQAGPDYNVLAIALQADGRVLIGGEFSHFGGFPRNYLARLKSDGTLDTTFNPGQGADSQVRTISIQSDGKAIIGGFFGAYDGNLQNGVARVNTNGAYDATFQSAPEFLDGNIFALQIQPDGKVVVAGDMTTGHLVRLNTDGSKDATYQPGLGPGDDVYTMAIQGDQKILIGGLFESVDTFSAPHVARINADLKMLVSNKSGSQFSTEVQTTAGKSYRLEYKTSFDQASWIPIPTSEVAGNGSFQSLYDTNAIALLRFYRVFGFND
jgi:uncharacterized delta-60 repeat protein